MTQSSRTPAATTAAPATATLPREAGAATLSPTTE